jgi:GAF domain-containing protein
VNLLAHDRHLAMTDNLTGGVTEKRQLYSELASQATGLLADESDLIANAANLASLIATSLPDLNWAGFYFLKGEELVLGPFQGKPACVRIGIGKGVCGTAALRKSAVLVRDVELFPGHIACDPNSRSELVVPLFDEDRLVGVLDLDSPIPGRFDSDDQAGCIELARILMHTQRHRHNA